MKQLYSFENGALIISEQGGDFFLAIDGSVGGGSVAGIVSGQAMIKLGAGSVALKAAELLLNHLAPAAMQPMLQAIEGVLNAAVAQV